MIVKCGVPTVPPEYFPLLVEIDSSCDVPLLTVKNHLICVADGVPDMIHSTCCEFPLTTFAAGGLIPTVRIAEMQKIKNAHNNEIKKQLFKSLIT